MNNKPAFTMIELLTPIWLRVLQRSSLNVDDNFFDIGGNLPLADVLFAEIAKVYGRELPSATICRAPTIRLLASMLEQPMLPRFSPYALMKAGQEMPAVFMVHGLFGYLEFVELARHIQTEHPIYGIQAKGADGLEEPQDNVEDMARYYLAELKEVQPHGPYIFIGYSIGGMVALEMARQLSEDGESIALLVMVDTFPHSRYLAPGQRLSLLAQRTRRRISKIKQHPPLEALSYLTRGIERRLHLFGVYSRSSLTSETSPLAFAQTALRVMPKAYVALAHYRPRFYPGKIKFVKAAGDSFFPQDPRSVWGKLVAELEVEKVPGDHSEIVTTHFETLAPVLSRYLIEALGEKKL